MIDEADRNGDGQIDEDEFYRYALTVCWWRGEGCSREGCVDLQTFSS